MTADETDSLMAGQLTGMRVLVVEDEYYIADDLRRSLAGAGAKVLGPVGTVAEAQTAIDKGEFDCVLLDLNLRGESGEVLADRLKGLGTPFAIATGYGSGAVPTRYSDVPRLEKPFDPSRVVDLISSWEQSSAV